jgi:hypothetical protein
MKFLKETYADDYHEDELFLKDLFCCFFEQRECINWYNMETSVQVEWMTSMFAHIMKTSSPKLSGLEWEINKYVETLSMSAVR